MIVHLIDGTYELFRHFHGQRRFNQGKDAPAGAVVGVLNGVLEMIEDGGTHLGSSRTNVQRSDVSSSTSRSAHASSPSPRSHLPFGKVQSS